MTKPQRLALVLFILTTIAGMLFAFSRMMLPTILFMLVSGIAGAYFVLGDGKQD